MIRTRWVSLALLTTTFWIAPEKAVWGQERTRQKLDKSLQQAIADGCSGGPQPVIIRVKSGYRQGMSDSLTSHGDKVVSSLTSIDAVAAEVHCDDLEALAEMSATKSISVDAPMEPHAKPATNGRQKKTATLTQAQAAAALKAPVFQSMLAWPQLRAASYLGSPTTTTDTSLRNTVSALLDMGITGAAGGIGVAVIDSGIVPGPEFENRI